MESILRSPLTLLIWLKPLWINLPDGNCSKPPPRSTVPVCSSDFWFSADHTGRHTSERSARCVDCRTASLRFGRAAGVFSMSLRETWTPRVTANETWGVTVWPAVADKRLTPHTHQTHNSQNNPREKLHRDVLKKSRRLFLFCFYRCAHLVRL